MHQRHNSKKDNQDYPQMVYTSSLFKAFIIHLELNRASQIIMSTAFRAAAALLTGAQQLLFYPHRSSTIQSQFALFK
jgi:hypothetical protein